VTRVLNPLMSQDARGSVAGTQFSSNVTGPHAGRKSTSTPASGDRVLEYRSQMGKAHHAFNALTPGQAASWDLTPDTPVKPREHFVKLYLARAARSLTQFTDYPGPAGPAAIAFLESLRAPAPGTWLDFSWLMDRPASAHVDIISRCTSRCSWDGHPRKFTWQRTYPFFTEEVSFDMSPNARYATVHFMVRDHFTLEIYQRWVYHWDDDTQISVTPKQPQD